MRFQVIGPAVICVGKSSTATDWGGFLRGPEVNSCNCVAVGLTHLDSGVTMACVCTSLGEASAWI